MSQLTITLSDELEGQIRQYVREHGYDSVSDFVRETTARAVSGRPTYWERAYLVHFLEIKQLLGGDINEELLDALRNGYSRYYSFEEDHVSRRELSDESMEFVAQVLEMYAQLQYSYNQLPEKLKTKELEDDVTFEGFDGNAGDGHLGYLHFLVKHGLYTYVKPLDKGHAINSHSHVTSIYQRMLDAYKTIKQDAIDHRPLTLDELKMVIGARIHPEFRKNETDRP